MQTERIGRLGGGPRDPIRFSCRSRRPSGSAPNWGSSTSSCPTLEPRTAFVLRDGQLHPLPEGSFLGFPVSVRGLVMSSLFTPLGKVRMAAEELIRPREWDDADDESIATFVPAASAVRRWTTWPSRCWRASTPATWTVVGPPAVSAPGGHRVATRELVAGVSRAQAETVGAWRLPVADWRRGCPRRGPGRAVPGRHGEARVPWRDSRYGVTPPGAYAIETMDDTLAARAVVLAVPVLRSRSPGARSRPTAGGTV